MTIPEESDAFWEWCRDMVRQGHEVYVSEEQAPPDFHVLWSRGKIRNIASQRQPKKIKTITKKVFLHEIQLSKDWGLL